MFSINEPMLAIIVEWFWYMDDDINVGAAIKPGDWFFGLGFAALLSIVQKL